MSIKQKICAVYEKLFGTSPNLCDDVDQLELGLSALEGKVQSINRLVYRLPDGNGMTLRRWLELPDALPHDNVDLIWTGPRDPLTGFSSHPNNPTSTTIDDWNYTGPDDQMEAFGVIRFDQPTWIRDNNGNTGERGEVWFGECCGIPRLLQQTVINTPSTDRVLLDPVLIPAGIHFFYVRQSDASANQGFDFEWSLNGTTGWANMSTLPTQKWTSKPKIQCQAIPVCDPIPQGWLGKAPEICDPIFSPVESGGVSLEEVQSLIDADHTPPAPATSIPIPDNEEDASIRVGLVGTSLQYARADHNHPIVRQSNPGWPVVTLSGPATENFSQNRIFRSNEEEVSFTYRKRFVTTTDNGWVIYQFVNIAGFQQPELTCNGVYLQTGDQDDTGKQVATMDSNGVVWADINRIYYGQFNGKETSENWWPCFRAKYTRV